LSDVLLNTAHYINTQGTCQRTGTAWTESREPVPIPHRMTTAAILAADPGRKSGIASPANFTHTQGFFPGLKCARIEPREERPGCSNTSTWAGTYWKTAYRKMIGQAREPSASSGTRCALTCRRASRFLRQNGFTCVRSFTNC